MNRHAQAEFNAWVARHHDKLRKRTLSPGNPLSEDAFQEAYLSAWSMAGMESDGRAFSEKFSVAYKDALDRQYDHEDRYVHPDPLFFAFLRNDSEDEDGRTIDDGVDSRQVDEYVKNSLPATDYALFHLLYVDGHTWREVASYTGCGLHTIDRLVKRIKADVKRHFAPPRAINVS